MGELNNFGTNRKNLTFVRELDIIMLSYFPPRVVEDNTQPFDDL